MPTVTFDPTTEQPVGSAPQGATQSVSFDPSTEQPVTGTQQQPSAEDVGSIYTEAAGNVLGAMGFGSLGNLGTGAVKSGLSPLAHLLNFVTRARPGQALDPNTVRGHVNDATQWMIQGGAPQGVLENLGALGEQTAELMGGEGLLRLAGKVPAIAGAVDTVANLKRAQQIAEFFRDHKIIAGLSQVGLNAVKDATIMGGQTYAHTGDTGEARRAAELGAATGGGLQALKETGAIQAAGKGVRSILDRFKPGTIDIGSQTGVPIEPGQMTGEGELTQAGTEERQNAIRQQLAFDRDMQVGSRRAARASLEQLNNAIGPEARLLLPPPSGEAMPAYTLTGPQGGTAEPFQFHLGGPPIEERTEGALTQPAERMPSQGVPPATAGGPWELRTEPEQVGGRTMNVTRERRGFGYLHPVPEGTPQAAPTVEDILEGRMPEARPPAAAPGREDIIGGGGAVRTTTNPAEAISIRNEYRRLMDSPEFGQFSPAQQAQIRTAHDYLTDQIGAFYAQPHGGIIPADIESATSHIVTPGDAADQLRMATKPGFVELNSLTKGRINELSDEIQTARSTLRDPKASYADKVEARDLIAARNAETNDLILRHAGDTPITRAYYNAMKTSYAHASFLDDLDDVIEGWSNGISRENTAKSGGRLTRVISADTNDFENFLQKGNNRDLLNNLMGPQAEETIKSWGQLLSNPATARKSGNVLENVMGWGMRHKLASMAMMGAPFFGYTRAYQVAAGTVAATYGARKLMRIAAMSPKVTSLVRYAVENNVDPRIYSPLIGRAISSLLPSREEEPEQPQKGAE